MEKVLWTKSDPYVCDVMYRSCAASREGRHFLNDALVGGEREHALTAKLLWRDRSAQLVVGDMTPDVSEERLERPFSELLGDPVNAVLERDADSLSPIRYGFLSFQSETSANFALVAGRRAKIGNACVRVGRAGRKRYLHATDLHANVGMEDLRDVFGKFGSLVDEDTLIIRGSYAFVRYQIRGAAVMAMPTLDKMQLKGRLSVRYAEVEALNTCVAEQFDSLVPRSPNSLKDLLLATFFKHQNCTVEIPRLHNNIWRRVALVTCHGDAIDANLAALEAAQSVHFVSLLPVCCQFVREQVPCLPLRGMCVERLRDVTTSGNGHNMNGRRGGGEGALCTAGSAAAARESGGGGSTNGSSVGRGVVCTEAAGAAGGNCQGGNVRGSVGEGSCSGCSDRGRGGGRGLVWIGSEAGGDGSGNVSRGGPACGSGSGGVSGNGSAASMGGCTNGAKMVSVYVPLSALQAHGALTGTATHDIGVVIVGRGVAVVVVVVGGGGGGVGPAAPLDYATYVASRRAISEHQQQHQHEQQHQHRSMKVSVMSKTLQGSTSWA